MAPHTPRMPPTALNRKGENEKISAPHNIGINPPIVEPINTPIQISVFEYIGF